MGLDTVDGKGERVILGTGELCKAPDHAARGPGGVFGPDSEEGLRGELGWFGAAGADSGALGWRLWRDPQDGREWIYYGFEEMQEGGWTCPAVYRTLLDRPGAGELVWNKAPVNVDSFQLSADGRMAGGNFPWPEGGVAELPNKSMKIFTKGCWPALHDSERKAILLDLRRLPQESDDL